MSELRPCPFCGGKAGLIQSLTSAYVMCRVCGVAQPKEYRVDGKDYTERAVRKWNIRCTNDD